jgi:hypothetical protein
LATIFGSKLPFRWRLQIHFAEAAFQRLFRLPVPRVPALVPGRVVLLVSQVARQFRLQRPFQKRLRQLPQQTILVNYVLRLFIVRQ